MTNVVNPFSSDLPVVTVASPYTKPTGTNQDPPINPLPFAPASYSAPFGANLALAITGLEATLNLTSVSGVSSNTNIETFNAQEITAMQNTLVLLSAIQGNSHASPFPFTTAQLQDIMVSVIAIQNSQYSGGYVTPADMANNNVTFGSANTGFFPEGAQTIVCNDQYMIAELPASETPVGTPPGFYWSNSANAMDWSVLNTAQMEAYSDQPLAMDQYSGIVVAFGIQSIEFYADTGLTPESGLGTTYESIPSTTQNYGLAAVFSRAPFMNSIAFLGQNRTGQAHVFLFNGYIPQIISSPDVDQIINSFSVINDAVAYSYDNNGKQFYQITFQTVGRTLLYNGTDDNWTEVQSGVMSEYGRHVTSQAVTFNSLTIASDCATGNVYILDPTSTTDNGFLIRREFITRHLNNEGNYFTVGQLWIEVNTGSSQQIGLGSNGTIQLYYSTDNGNTWKGPMNRPVGGVGQFSQRVTWRHVCRARDVVFRFVCTDPIPLVFVRGIAEITPGTG